MRLFLHDGPHRLQILSERLVRRYRDLASARELVRSLVGEAGNRRAIREAMESLEPATVLDDEQLVERLAAHLVEGDLCVVSCASAFAGLSLESTAEEGSGSAATEQEETEETTPAEDEAAAQEEQAETAEDPEPEHFIEIELLDDQGEPLSGEQYYIELPDGTSVSGSLDDNGYARIDGIDPGQAQISFPNLDKSQYGSE